MGKAGRRRCRHANEEHVPRSRRRGSRGARPPHRGDVPRRRERGGPRTSTSRPAGPLAEALGYPADLLDRLPAGAVSSFAGVGYHLGLARLLPGERVLDLGSGSGMDVFAAAVQVGPGGSVIGVDITPEQLAKSERLRRDGHVSFRRARIEDAAVRDGSFDAVISNGVVNLSADKRRVFAEAARVLRPGGRLALADIVTERQIAARTACQADLWAACIAGPARQISTWRTSRPPASSVEVDQRQPGLRLHERAGTAHEPQVRRPQRVAARASSRYVHPATPPARIWVVAPMPRERRRGRVNQTPQRPRRSRSERSDRHDPQRRGHREDVRHAGSDQGAAGAGEVPVPRHQPLDRRRPQPLDDQGLLRRGRRGHHAQRGVRDRRGRAGDPARQRHRRQPGRVPAARARRLPDDVDRLRGRGAQGASSRPSSRR